VPPGKRGACFRTVMALIIVTMMGTSAFRAGQEPRVINLLTEGQLPEIAASRGLLVLATIVFVDTRRSAPSLDALKRTGPVIVTAR
jgi:hypothetical protein